LSASNEFHQFYREFYGPRWDGLYQSLLIPEKKILRWNRFNNDQPSARYEPVFGDAVLQNQFQCYYLPENAQGEIPRGSEGLLLYYVMDLASVVAAKVLNVGFADKVLDMCAAPGGKSLVLAEALKEGGELIANEISEARRDSLKKVIQQYISKIVRERVWMTGKDGGKFALTHRETFDRILVDAPCSGERHLLQAAEKLKEWKVSRSEKLAHRQYALLTGALLAAKAGAKIVYSTCSVSPLENDGVIRHLRKKKSDQFEVLPAQKFIEGTEDTEFGQMIMPDRSGYGPIYICEMRKL
jgi:16S rRNA C967 or C1407 C5-methylase (RsmB/RsmF family)